MHTSSQVPLARPHRRPFRAGALTSALALVLGGLSLWAVQGCGSAGSVTGPLPQITVRGVAHGGKQPVANASLQLYAAGQSGVASGATALTPGNLQTSSDGSFAVTVANACPSASAPVYLVARGGNPGLYRQANPAITLMATLGPCGELAQGVNVTLNEVTTAATVFSLASFMQSAAQVGTEASLASLFAGQWAQASALADMHAGTAGGPNATALPSAVPVAKLNSLANLIATCVNSAGGSAGDNSLCGQLFAYTTANGVTPTDTVGALLQIARSPSLQAGNLFALLGPTAPFQPQLTSAPSDWGLLSSSGIGLATVPVVVPPVTVPDPIPPVTTPPPAPDPVPAPPVVTPPQPVQPNVAKTWYVRADGAPHFSQYFYSDRGAQPGHSCDGLYDAPWPTVGSRNVLGQVSNGTNQPCALSDWRWLYDNQSQYGKLVWIISGGDTVILDNARPWRVGYDTDGTGGELWCFGLNSANNGCTNPTIPAGTAAQHTRILGRNWASCSANNGPNKTKMSQLFGGHGVGTALNLNGAQYVDVQCIEITRHSQCVRHGAPLDSSHPFYDTYCRTSAPYDDYDSDGINTDTGTHDLLLQDMWIHGHPDRGIIGPIGGTVIANRLDIDTNGMAGWDFDNGSATPNVVGSTLYFNYSTIEWSGCNQEFPAVHPIPVKSCYSQSSGGYGDGIGTPANDTLNAFIDHSVFRYNTQDGADFLHIDTGSSTISISNSTSFGNNGAQFKWGPNFTSVTLANNIAIGNCMRMSASIPGLASNYNANLADFCRAGDALVFSFKTNQIATFQNNTIVNYAPTTMDIACSGTTNDCTGSIFTFKNNIIFGYDNPATYNSGGRQGGPGIWCGAGCNDSTVRIPTLIRQNNVFYGLRPGANSTQASGAATHETVQGDFVADPQFVNEPTGNGSRFNEAELDNFNPALTPGSPAAGLGVDLTLFNAGPGTCPVTPTGSARPGSGTGASPSPRGICP